MNGWYWSVNGWRLERILNYYLSRNSSIWKNYLLLKAGAKFAMWHMIQHTNPKLEISVPERSCVNNLLQKYKMWQGGLPPSTISRTMLISEEQKRVFCNSTVFSWKKERDTSFLFELQASDWDMCMKNNYYFLTMTVVCCAQDCRRQPSEVTIRKSLKSLYFEKKNWVLLTRSQTQDLWWLSHGKGHHGCKAKLGSCDVNRELQEWKCTMSTSLLAGS